MKQEPAGGKSGEEKPSAARERCRFLTSYDGVTRCREPEYFHRFCEFHFEAYLRGEIDAGGHISESLSDQKRRREINYYGIDLPPAVPDLLREPEAGPEEEKEED